MTWAHFDTGDKYFIISYSFFIKLKEINLLIDNFHTDDLFFSPFINFTFLSTNGIVLLCHLIASPSFKGDVCVVLLEQERVSCALEVNVI
jgi:hypothetical protein